MQRRTLNCLRPVLGKTRAHRFSISCNLLCPQPRHLQVPSFDRCEPVAPRICLASRHPRELLKPCNVLCHEWAGISPLAPVAATAAVLPCALALTDVSL